MKILISIATRNRPLMLQCLIESLKSIIIPKNNDVDFLIVENNGHETLHRHMQFLADRMPGRQVRYMLEKNIGICFSRNCALNYAADNGYDLLVFLDDDERPQADWLVELLAEQQRKNLDIVGSPVRPIPVAGALTLCQNFVWSGLQRMASRSEWKCRRKYENGRADTIKIATGSWMGKLDFFRKTGLRFDTYFGLTGGEDWHLWAQAKALGAKTGWAPDAIVYETVPLCRLTLSYHFRRSCDHNTTEFVTLYRQNKTQVLRKLPSRFASRSWKLLISIGSIPVKGAPAVLASASALGGLAGLLRGCVGKQSLHYARITGH